MNEIGREGHALLEKINEKKWGLHIGDSSAFQWSVSLKSVVEEHIISKHIRLFTDSNRVLSEKIGDR